MMENIRSPSFAGNESGDTAVTLASRAQDIYGKMQDLPIISSHGHCNPAWFSQNKPFADPAELLIIPDHYVFRMLYSQGVDLRDLGIGAPAKERDPEAIFALLAQHWHKFLGTPSHLWLTRSLACSQAGPALVVS